MNTTIRLLSVTGTVWVLLWLLALPGFAEIISFNPPTYALGKPIEGRDGWLRALNEEGDSLQYVMESEDEVSGRLHAHTSSQYTITRAFSNSVTALDLKWRWRFENPSSVKFCMGVGKVRDTSNIPLKFCVYPSGELHYTGSSGNMITTGYEPGIGTWNYMKLHVDLKKGLWVLTSSTQPNRLDEEVLVDSTPVQSSMKVVVSTDPLSGKVGRLFLRSEDGDPDGAVDVDDIDWQRADRKTWVGSKDSLWTTGGNWSPTGVPDSTDVVVFNSSATRVCQLDKAVVAEDLILASDFTRTLHLSGYNLVLHGSAEFYGGRIRGNASTIKFRGPKLHVLIPPAQDTLPSLLVEGPGSLQFGTRIVRTLGLKVTGGGLDFNGQNVEIDGDLILQNGNATSIQGIGERIVSVTGSANLTGTQGSLLNLAPNMKWYITVKKNLAATYARIGNSHAMQSTGIASMSVNMLGNDNWNFREKPKLAEGPDTLFAVVNESHAVSVKVLNPIGGETYRWTRNGVPDAQNFGPEFFIPTVTLANDGDVFVCTVTNSEGATVSGPTVLSVRFPAPKPTVDFREFSDSLAVGFESQVGNSIIWASRNGGAYAKWTGNVVIKSDTRWDVYSVLGTDKSDTATYQFYSTNRPKAATPAVKPPGGDFSGSIEVSMEVAEPASIAYRLDTLLPAADSIEYRESFALKSTTVITAMGLGEGMRNSLPVRVLFLDTSVKGDLQAPLAKPSVGVVDSGTVVQLSTDTGSLWYRFEPGPWIYSPAGKVALAGHTQFEAVAVHGSRQSPVQTFKYLNGLSAPTANHPSKRFRDSLFIRWSTTSKEAVIYAAINRNPTLQDRFVDSMRIDNTCFVRAIAIRGTDSSQITEIQYKLDPETPSSFPLPADLVEPGKVTLSSPTKKGSIYFTLDGKDPDPSNWMLYSGAISVDSTLELKAVTVTGSGAERLISPIYSAFYKIKARDEVTLKPNDTVSLSDDWNLALNAGGSPNVLVIKAPLPTGLNGFDSLSLPFQIRGSQKGDSVSVILEDTLSGDKDLWYLPPDARKPLRLPQGRTISLRGDGTYFLGIDTMPPVLRFSGSSINSEKFTLATFTLDDNGSAIDYQIWRTDKKDSVQSVRGASTEVVLKLALKNPPNALQNLGVRICAVESQGRNRTCLPKSQELFLPLQQHTDGVVTPSVWNVGGFKDTKWDLVGLPFDMDSGLTVRQLQTWNERKDLTIAFYKPTAPKGFEFLKLDDKLVQGRAYWVASAKALSELEFGSGQMHVASETAFQYTLSKGWNAISGKQLTGIPWPVQHMNSTGPLPTRLKGLWAIHPETGDWDRQDTLYPWRGYYVHWAGELDTVIDLAGFRASAKRTASSIPNWFIDLSQAGARLQLGASPGASDGVSIEDESALPDMRASRSLLVSLRGKQVLGSDYVALHPERLHSWTVRWENKSAAAFQIRRAVMPDGYGLIAYSKGRRIGLDLLAGRDAFGNVAGLDVPVGFSDTLQVLAGPTALLKRELEKWPSLPKQETIRWLGSGKLALELSANRKATFAVLDAKGRIKYRHSLWLPAGRLVWSLPAQPSSIPGPQWVRVSLTGNGSQRSQSFAWFGF